MNIVERINRRLPIFEQADASWKNSNLPDYDRQYAEDCLHHTIGPLTDNPRWDDTNRVGKDIKRHHYAKASERAQEKGYKPPVKPSEKELPPKYWNSASEPPPEWKPGGPAPRWTADEVIMAMAGDPALLFGAKGDPRSPKYGMGAPVLRIAMQAIRIMRQTGDTKKSLIEDCYGLGLVELIKLTKPGYDEGIAPFISWAQPLIRSAISLGIGKDTGGIAATSDNETTQKFADPTDMDKPTTGPFRDRRKRRLSVKTKGMGALMRETDPEVVRQAASVVKGQFREKRLHDKHPDNPYGAYSPAFYQIAMAYADALESGDNEQIERAHSRMQQFISTTKESQPMMRGIQTGLDQDISNPDRKGLTWASMRDKRMDTDEGEEEAQQQHLRIQSINAVDDEGNPIVNTGGLSAPKEQSGIFEREQVNYLLDMALTLDLSDALRNSEKYHKLAQDHFYKDTNELVLGKLESGKGRKDIKIGGPLTVSEFRYVIRHIGEAAADYPGKGHMRANLDIPRDGRGWCNINVPNPEKEDPEIEQIPGKTGIWHSIWSRNGYECMKGRPGDIAAEMTQEVHEFIKLGIQTARAEKVTAIGDGGRPGVAMSNVAINTALKLAETKLYLIAVIHAHGAGFDDNDIQLRRASKPKQWVPSTGNLRPEPEKTHTNKTSKPKDIGPDRDQIRKELPESIRRALPMLESLSRIDRYLIVETCNMIIANIQETLAADWFRSPQRKYHPRRYSIT